MGLNKLVFVLMAQVILLQEITGQGGVFNPFPGSPGGSFAPGAGGAGTGAGGDAAGDFPSGPMTDPSTENCELEACGFGCSSKSYTAVCHELATDEEIEKFFSNLMLFKGNLPLTVSLEGKRKYKAKTFAPVKDNLVHLVIAKHDGFSFKMLKGLTLPTLLALTVQESHNVTLGSGELTSFSRLREVAFVKTTVWSIAKKSFEVLTDLQLLALDGGYQPPFTQEERDHLLRLHCDCKNAWIRAYLVKHPLVIQPKARGEIYKVGMLWSEAVEKELIFYPVNCTVGIVEDASFESELYSVDDVCPGKV
ncbi:hypothetical protein BV898_06161 [Hypsibius exemplaris]|uniref:Uncharacterized protein n=1 Tax=Hypsibius exemplaris TaxID=2072580 RepID=A0A1W0WXM4_HYPEX|nr:hypothetical protein BV898_06161 [Hypsibius exemplaris]